jgi:hypothetical protein
LTEMTTHWGVNVVLGGCDAIEMLLESKLYGSQCLADVFAYSERTLKQIQKQTM